MDAKKSLIMVSVATAFMALSVPAAFADELEDRQERHEDVQEAISEGDYDTFSEYFDLDEESFDILVEAQDLRDEGDDEAARQLLITNEVKTAQWFRKEYQKQQALSNLTDEQKEALKEAHELREDGEFEEAREVLIEAEVKPKGYFKHHHHGQNCDQDA